MENHFKVTRFGAILIELSDEPDRKILASFVSIRPMCTSRMR